MVVRAVMLEVFISTHDLARRSTPSEITIKGSGYIFQLTTSQGGRLLQLLSLPIPDLHFNSRPREEVDGTNLQVEAGTIISTHDLTRRSTAFQLPANNIVIISTHDLTRRSTHT